MRTQGMADDWLAGIVLRQKVLQLISPTSVVKLLFLLHFATKFLLLVTMILPLVISAQIRLMRKFAPDNIGLVCIKMWNIGVAHVLIAQ